MPKYINIEEDSIVFQGISNEIITSLGKISLSLFNKQVDFSVIPDHINIAHDGIFGLQFLNQSNRQ